MTQPLAPPSYTKKIFITRQVTADYFVTLIESICCVLHAHPTGLSRMRTWFTLGLLLLSSSASYAKGVYQTSETFLQESFQGEPPTAQVIWLNASLKKAMANILNHPYRGLRLRYWGKGQRTAWILNEIGKEKPITIGVTVQAGQLKQVSILTFRESRGGEVGYPAFTDQFNNARLDAKHNLDRSIDGISGATLSVRAVKKIARLALFLHQQTSFAHVQTQ